MVAIDDFMSDDVDLESAKKPGGGFYVSPIARLPKSGEILQGKFLVIPDGTKRPCIRVEYHDFMVGPDPMKDGRMHFCIKATGATSCPRCEAFWENIKARKKLKGEGSENSPAYKKTDMLQRLHRAKKGGIFLFIPKDGNKIQPLFVKEDMLKQLIGAEEDKFYKKPATTGLIETMRNDGMSPFNLKSPVGWVKLGKTGTGTDTKFFAVKLQVAQEVIINGRKTKADVAVEADVNQAIIDAIVARQFPDLMALMSAPMEMWTLEDNEEFVNSMVIPERFAKKAKRESQSPAKTAYVAEEDFMDGDVDNSPNLAAKPLARDFSDEFSDDVPF